MAMANAPANPPSASFPGARRAEPRAFLQIDAAVRQKHHALVRKQRALRALAAKREAAAQAAVLEHNAMAGDLSRLRVAVQCKANAPRPARVARQRRYPRGICRTTS